MRAVLLAAAIVGLAECGPPKACFDVPAAYKALQPFILRELAVPGAAAFPPLGAIRLTPVNDCEFVGAGYVDTRSAAGRPLRTYYRAHVRLDRPSGRYEKLSLEFSSL